MNDKLPINDERKLTSGAADYEYVLSDLGDAYPDKHHPIDLRPFTGPDMLELPLEQFGMTASGLGRLPGNRQLGSAIPRGNRQRSKTHIPKIRDQFKVKADLFL